MKMAVLTAAALAAFACAPGSATAAEPQGTIDPHRGKPCHACHRSMLTGRYVHEPVASKECTPCHPIPPGNHLKDKTLFAVKDKSAKLCQECHTPSEGKSVHPVIEAEGCLGCHGAHASSLRHLLRYKVPRLCFNCHDKQIAKEKETAKGTAFRDGQQNLHFVHAGKQNRIPCLTCHDSHQSSQLYLIRPKGKQGKDEVTITYTATDKGGNCTTSCHDEMAYERK